jgi:hypothetical protein
MGTMRRPLMRGRRVVALTPPEFERRAKWGGLIDGIPELTDDERAEWQRMREANGSWVPQAAMRFMWNNVDALHGDGAWSWRGFLEALDADRQEIARVITTHPAQASRLNEWAVRVEALGRRRNGDSGYLVGPFYEQLMVLGFSANG